MYPIDTHRQALKELSKRIESSIITRRSVIKEIPDDGSLAFILCPKTKTRSERREGGIERDAVGTWVGIGDWFVDVGEHGDG